MDYHLVLLQEHQALATMPMTPSSQYGSEYLAILQNIDVSLLTEADFVNVDIA